LIEDSELHCTTRPSVSRFRRVRDLRPAGASASELSDTTIRDRDDTDTLIVDLSPALRQRHGRTRIVMLSIVTTEPAKLK
jgi:hypothetical protein